MTQRITVKMDALLCVERLAFTISQKTSLVRVLHRGVASDACDAQALVAKLVASVGRDVASMERIARQMSGRIDPGDETRRE